MSRRGWIGSFVLLVAVAGAGGGLAAWKYASIRQASAASASQPEPMEAVTVAVARERQHSPTTTSIGTVIALRSITLRNELPGTVRQVRLTPGQVVEAGTVLVALDVSVEEAELSRRPLSRRRRLGRRAGCRKGGGMISNPDPKATADRDTPRSGRWAMTIRLDHTIVPAKDKVASARFFAEIFGLKVKPDPDHFAQVQVNDGLTLDFADEPEPWGGLGFDPRTGQSHHYAFHVSEMEFEAIFRRVKAMGIPYGSEPHSHTDGRIPPGTPMVPDGTTHGALHYAFSALVFTALPAACFVVAYRFATSGRRGWAVYSVGTAVALLIGLVLAGIGFSQHPTLMPIGGLLQRLTIIVGWAWLTALAPHLLRRASEASQITH